MACVRDNRLEIVYEPHTRQKSAGPLFQWDRGIELAFVGFDEITQTVVAHCSFEGQRQALQTTTKYEDNMLIVGIPDELLRQTKPLHVYLYIEDKQSGLTTCDIRIPVTARPKPTDYVYDQADTIPSIDAILDILDNVKELTEEAEKVANLAAVRYDIPQALTEEQRRTARENIGVGEGTGGGSSLPSGGQAGQVLVKTENGAGWATMATEDTVVEIQTEVTEIRNELTQSGEELKEYIEARLEQVEATTIDDGEI